MKNQTLGRWLLLDLNGSIKTVWGTFTKSLWVLRCNVYEECTSFHLLNSKHYSDLGYYSSKTIISCYRLTPNYIKTQRPTIYTKIAMICVSCIGNELNIKIMELDVRNQQDC